MAAAGIHPRVRRPAGAWPSPIPGSRGCCRATSSRRTADPTDAVGRPPGHGDRAARPRAPRRLAVPELRRPPQLARPVARRGPRGRRACHARRHAGDGRPDPCRGSSSSSAPLRRPPTRPRVGQGPDAARARPATSSWPQPRRPSRTCEPALPGFRAAGDRVWEARTLNLIGPGATWHSATSTRRDQRRRAAEEIFAQRGPAPRVVITAAQPRHRSPSVGATCPAPSDSSTRRPRATPHSAMDEAKLVIDQCEAMLTAGLADEAVELVRGQARQGLPVGGRAGRAAVGPGVGRARRPVEHGAFAAERTARPALLFRRQGREWNALNAELAVLLARSADPVAACDGRVRRPTSASRLEAGGSDDAAVAWLLAGRVGLAVEAERSAELLDRAAAYRHHGLGLVRATGWHARALAARRRRTDRRACCRACRRGLEAARRAPSDARELGAAGAGDPARRRAGEPGLAARGQRAAPARCWSGANAGAPPR